LLRAVRKYGGVLEKLKWLFMFLPQDSNNKNGKKIWTKNAENFQNVLTNAGI
jgi:hypothetical protein